MTPKSTGTYWETPVADIQEDLAVDGNAITGTLLYYDDESKALVRDWGEGYFMAVGFDDFSTGLTYANVQAGLEPSAGSGLVTLDSDKDIVLHVTNPDQKLVAKQTDPETGDVRIQKWSLKRLTYAPKE